MKYVLTNETLTIAGRTLFRIQATKDIKDEKGNILVHAGERGGFVESILNLSHSGSCWIYGDAKVYDRAKILDDAQVRDKAEVWTFATIKDKAIVKHWARVHGKTVVQEDSIISEHADVGGYSSTIRRSSGISGYARVGENADVEFCQVHGKAYIHGNSKCSRSSIFEEADISGNSQVSVCRVYKKAKVSGDANPRNRDVTRDISKAENGKYFADGGK